MNLPDFRSFVKYLLRENATARYKYRMQAKPAGGERYYTHIPGPADPVQLRILETLLEEKQLLIDLIAAVEALTSAVLCALRRE